MERRDICLPMGMGGHHQPPVECGGLHGGMRLLDPPRYLQRGGRHYRCRYVHDRGDHQHHDASGVIEHTSRRNSYDTYFCQALPVACTLLFLSNVFFKAIQLRRVWVIL